MAKAPGKRTTTNKGRSKSSASAEGKRASTRVSKKTSPQKPSSDEATPLTSSRNEDRGTPSPEALSPRARHAEIVEPEIIETDETTDEAPNGSLSPDDFGFDEIEIKDIDPDKDDLAGDLQELTESLQAKGPTKRAISPEIVEPSGSKALRPADPVATYLAEIRRYPLLTKEQEQELARRYRETGDPRAAELLVTSNLRFVVKIAAEYSRFGAKLIDLIQEGNVGLMHAVKEFNPYKGVRLITYAVWWIRGYIQEYLMRQYSMVRIGTTQNQRKLFYRLQKEKELLDSMGREPNYALLSSRLGVSEAEVETMTKRLSGRDVSLNQPLDGSGQSAATLLDFEPSEMEAVDETLGHLEEMEVLKENLEKIRNDLSEKELYVLENRVLSDEPKTLQEIGEHFGVTREAVRQLEARLIGKIRNAVTQSLGGGPDHE